MKLRSVSKRDMMIYLLREHGEFSLKEIGEQFGISYEAVRKIHKKLKKLLTEGSVYEIIDNRKQEEDKNERRGD